jgi:DNA-binding MarR family transcriptional regulator
MSNHPIHDLDDDVHQRVRLGILASLDGLTKAQVSHLKTTLELTDGNLGRHLQALEAGGLITQSRTNGDGRPRTWVKITTKGRRALRDEIRALQRLLGALSQNEPEEQNVNATAAPGSAPARAAARTSTTHIEPS